MWSYIKSFYYKVNTDNSVRKKPTARETSMMLRHRTASALNNMGLKWSTSGWSRRLIPHTDWTIKVQDSITLPYIESINKNINLISAKLIPIMVHNRCINLQKYLEDNGQYNPDININYTLSTYPDEQLEIKCIVVIIPHIENLVHTPSKSTHLYDNLTEHNLLIVTNSQTSVSIREEKRKQNFDLPTTIISNSPHKAYNVCLEIPLIKSSNITNIFVRDFNRSIKGNLVYYLYLDHDKITNDDLTKINQIFLDFKNEKYDL